MKKIINKKSSFLVSSAIVIFFLSVLFLQNTSLLTNEVKSLYPGLRLMSNNDTAEDYIKGQIKTCEGFSKNDGEGYKCLHILGKMLSEQIEFKKIVLAFRSSSIECHDLMHNILNEQYKKGAKIEDVWTECSSTCDNACYHGGLEGLLTKSKNFEDDKELQSLIKKICEPIEDKFSEIHYQCFHGAGHAFMLLTNGDLPKSLMLCDSIEEAGLRTNCYGGVFMENFPNSKSGRHITSFTNDEDPLYPCNAIDKKYQYSCYSFQPSYYLYISRGDMEKFASICALVPQEYQNGCYYQFGFMSVKKQGDEQLDIFRTCELVPEIYPKTNCVKGVVMGYGKQSPKGFRIMENEEIYDICEILEGTYKKSCHEQIEIARKEAKQDLYEIKKECGGIENIEEKDKCINQDQ